MPPAGRLAIGPATRIVPLWKAGRSRGGSAVYTLVTCGFDDDAGLIRWSAPPL